MLIHIWMQYFIIVFNIFYVSCDRLVRVIPVYFGNDCACLPCFVLSCETECSDEIGFSRLRNSTLNLPTVERSVFFGALHGNDVRNLARETCIFAVPRRTWETWVAFQFVREYFDGADHAWKRWVT